jgi:hypothetical protein
MKLYCVMRKGIPVLVTVDMLTAHLAMKDADRCDIWEDGKIVEVWR